VPDAGTKSSFAKFYLLKSLIFVMLDHAPLQ